MIGAGENDVTADGESSSSAVTSTYVVYRFYALDGSLLYVGSSNNFERRRKEHKKTQPWFNQVSSETRMPFNSRPEALAAERHAIESERPRYNKTHRETPATRSTPSRRLVWTCEECRLPIADRTGYLWVDRYEVNEKMRQERARDELSERSPLVLIPLDLSKPMLGRWKTHHLECDTKPDADLCSIGVERIRTIEDVYDWTMHVLGKTWAHYTNWANVMRLAQRQLG